MENILFIVSSVAALAFWVGLVKPSLVGMPNRKKSSLVYLLVCLITGGMAGYLYPEQRSPEEIALDRQKAAQAEIEAKKFKYPTTTVAEYQSKNKKEREGIISNFMQSEAFPESEASRFYNCLSELSATRKDGVRISTALGWCADDYKKDPKLLDKRTNFDTFYAQFSGWDGAYRPLEKIIKESMNDEDSYKHVRTSYRILMDGAPHAIISTTFSGTNVYAARVKQTISADVDIKTGQIITIIDQ